MKNLILFAEQAIQDEPSKVMQTVVNIGWGLCVFAAIVIIYMLYQEITEGPRHRRKMYAIGKALEYMDNVASKDYDVLDSKYEKKSAKQKRK